MSYTRWSPQALRFAQREGFFCSPQLCVGFLFLILYPGSPPSRLPPPIFHAPSLSTIFVNHHLSHTISHTPPLTHHLCQPPSITYHLSHTIFVNHLCQPPSLSTTIFHTPSLTHHLSHTSLSTTIFHTPSWSTTLRGRCGSHPPSFCVAGVALMALMALGGALGPVLVADDAAALCVAGVALGHIHRSFHVAGVAQSHIHLFHLCFARQAWHSWHWVARLGPD